MTGRDNVDRVNISCASCPERDGARPSRSTGPNPPQRHVTLNVALAAQPVSRATRVRMLRPQRPARWVRDLS